MLDRGGEADEGVLQAYRLSRSQVVPLKVLVFSECFGGVLGGVLGVVWGCFGGVFFSVFLCVCFLFVCFVVCILGFREGVRSRYLPLKRRVRLRLQSNDHITYHLPHIIFITSHLQAHEAQRIHTQKNK